MNIKTVIRQLGFIIMLEGYFMLIPGMIALLLEPHVAAAFILPAIFLILIGFILFKWIGKNADFTIREGVATVVLTWILVPLFGSPPLFFIRSYSQFC